MNFTGAAEKQNHTLPAVSLRADWQSSGTENKALKAAHWYRAHGYSVIPVGAGDERKRPYIKWEPYQTKYASEDEIRQWWERWPNANIALVTGIHFGIMVVDCDTYETPDAVDRINEFISDDLKSKIPMASTPKGGMHFYFEYQPGLVNRARPLDGIDIRTDGGYILAPPSSNSKGKYKWLSGRGLHDVAPAIMPELLFETLHQACGASALSSAHIIERIHSSSSTRGGSNQGADHKRPRVTTTLGGKAPVMKRFFIPPTAYLREG